MNKEEIINTLHHRDPYLMVDSVESLSSTKISATKTLSNEHSIIKAHFPGAPIVPGAMIQEMCTQSAGILMTKFYSPVPNYNSNTTDGYAIGVLNKVKNAKYIGVTKPDSPIKIEVDLVEHFDNLFNFKAKVSQGDDLKAKLNFNLMIVSDEVIK